MSKHDYTFAEAVANRLRDQGVEIYCGDSGETHKFSDTESTEKSIIRGIVKDALGDCLILEVTKQGLTATVYMNAFNIRAIVPMSDSLYIKDIYDDEEFGFPKGRR
ncbi:MAG TPA: hypothetical protein VM577_14215 [Anaerovoracaceae bacterium]|nr:hypothetical protein [Anaerovoracaceae bacterium]